MDVSEFLKYVAIALSAGFLIGLEREFRLRSAGLTTNALVAVGAAIYVMASMNLTVSTGDPSRVLGQIATGIGFLGAGVIMRDGLNIHGLNSAATIWCSAAVGALVGLGLVAEAYIAAAAVVVINLLVRELADLIDRFALKKKESFDGVRIHLFTNDNYEKELKSLLMKQFGDYPELTVKSYTSRKANLFASSAEIICELTFTKDNEKCYNKFIADITNYPHLLKFQQYEGFNN